MTETMKDYYRILDIPFNADQIEVEKAYRRLKSLITKNSISLYSILPTSEKESFLNDVEEAYQILSDPYKRENYNSTLKGDVESATQNRDSDMIKQLSFGFAREAFTFLDYTRKSEELYNEAIGRIRNDYLTYSEGLSIKIVEENSEVAGTVGNAIEKSQLEDKSENQSPIIPVESHVKKEIEDRLESKEISQTIDKETDIREDTILNPRDIAPTSNASPQTNIETKPIGVEEKTPIVVDENSEFSGNFLRQIRESMGISIKDIAQTTKISISNIRYLEEENYENLPAPVYIKGYLSQIAKCLNLRADIVIRSYIARMNNRREKKDK
ncbi:MAG: helix-turn-helix domain-containing protein [Myxococcota bacterium]